MTSKAVGTLPLIETPAEPSIAQQLARLTAHRDPTVFHPEPIPEGVVKVAYINSGPYDEPEALACLVERLRHWTLVTNYAHYSVCADGLVMFCGNFEEYVYGFQFDVRRGSPADAFFRELMHANPGWQR